ncbi:MAG: hypothetical protein R3181_09295 [Rubricoccaceae bacterium]|nr:hypothetical protein [Rubricoccaceae bacterium]
MRAPLRPALVLLALLVAAGPTRGQQPLERSEHPAFQCRLPMPAPGASGSPVGHAFAPNALARGRGEAAADIRVTYDGFSDDAQAAFQAAVDVWAEHITSPVPIRINARCTDLGGNLLGSAGPFLVRNFGGAPVANTWYPYALADALSGRDLDASRVDIQADFNSGFDRWYLGTDGQGPGDQVELFTVVLHELGHGLGFIGSAAVENGMGSFGLEQDPSTPFVFDRFAEDAQGRSLLNQSVYPQPSAALADVLTDRVFFGGSAVEAVYGQPAPLFAPPSWNAGSSFSHFDETLFPPSEPDGLMTPLIAPGEKKESPGPLLCAALQDLGWGLSPACDALVTGGGIAGGVSDRAPASGTAFSGRAGSCAGSSSGPPASEPFALEIVEGNPFRGETAVGLTVRDAQRVQAWLVDAAGRRLTTLFEGTLFDGETTFIDVDGTDLPAGVYFVYVVGETFSETATVTNLR